MDHHPLSTNVVVSADHAATRSARAVVRDLCRDAATDVETVETAVLLVTELVSNAIEHGGGTATIEVTVDRSRLRVAVADSDPRLPSVNIGEVDDERGRGLLLVDALASRWAAEPEGTGKVVWFELDHAPAL